MTSAPDRFGAAFVAAAAAPALITGLLFAGQYGPGTFMPGFFIALILAAFHVALLAVPIHALLSRRGTPGPPLVLACSFLIGALPMPLVFGWGEFWEPFAMFGLLGVSGGIAFLLVSGPREDDLVE